MLHYWELQYFCILVRHQQQNMDKFDYKVHVARALTQFQLDSGYIMRSRSCRF